MAFEHISVLLYETVDGLNVKPDGIYVDATLGGGGHAYEVCSRLAADIIIINKTAAIYSDDNNSFLTGFTISFMISLIIDFIFNFMVSFPVLQHFFNLYILLPSQIKTTPQAYSLLLLSVY